VRVSSAGFAPACMDAAGWLSCLRAYRKATHVPKIIQIAMFVLIPLAWGLLVDYVFERVRRRRRGAQTDAEAAEHEVVE